MSMELMQDKQHETTALLVITTKCLYMYDMAIPFEPFLEHNYAKIYCCIKIYVSVLTHNQLFCVVSHLKNTRNVKQRQKSLCVHRLDLWPLLLRAHHNYCANILFSVCNIQINTMSGNTVQMQLEYKSMHMAGFEQMKSPSMASFMGYETLSKVAIPMESVLQGMEDLQDKIQPIPVAVS